MGGVALQAPAALWQLCGFHRDRLAPAGIRDPSRAGGSDGKIGSGRYSLGFQPFDF